MNTYKIFLASSAELKDDRDQFELEVSRKSNDWAAKGVILKVVRWEDFLDALAATRLQDKYNEEISHCAIFVMLFWTKVGPYTEEEFDRAVSTFKATSKPFVYTYFKDAPVRTGSDDEGLLSLLLFKKKLKALGHFHTTYKNVEGLQLHFLKQLDKMVANGFIQFPAQDAAGGGRGNVTQHAQLAGDGASAQGAGAMAVGKGGVAVRGNNSGNINTGTQTTVGNVAGDFVGHDKVTQGISPRDLEPLFAPLLATVAHQAPPGQQASAMQKVEQLKSEVAKGQQADDGKIGTIVEGLVALVPGAVSAVVSMFATPLLGGIVGPVTKFVLDKFKTD